MNWLTLSLIAMMCWGVWSLLTKVAFDHFNWYQVLITTSLVSILTSLLLYFHFRPAFNIHSPGFFYAVFAGVASSIAVVAFYMALSRGKATIIVPLTALYPVVTIILSRLFLHERTTLLQSLGIALAIIAILLISME